MPPAGNELLGLGEEFDLPDAAAAELDIVALDRDLVVTAIGVDLPLHVVDVGHRGKVQIFAPDEGRELAEQCFTGAQIAGTWARLDQRGALPILPAAFVVIEGRRRGDGDLGRGRVRAQPQIGAKHVAVGGALLQQLHQRARDPHVKRRGLGRLKRGSGVVEHDEVDVARIVELARPHLAHCQHDVARACRRALGVGDLEPAAALRIREQVVDRAANGGIGEPGLTLDDLHHRPNPADIGERNQQRARCLHVPEQAHDLGFITRCCDGSLCVDKNLVEAALRLGLEQPYEPGGIGARQLPQIARALRQPHDQPIQHGMSR